MAIQSRSRPLTSLSAGISSTYCRPTVKTTRRATAAACAEDDAPNPLPARQRATGQRDDDGVVAGEQDIDPG